MPADFLPTVVCTSGAGQAFAESRKTQAFRRAAIACLGVVRAQCNNHQMSVDQMSVYFIALLQNCHRRSNLEQDDAPIERIRTGESQLALALVLRVEVAKLLGGLHPA